MLVASALVERALPGLVATHDATVRADAGGIGVEIDDRAADAACDAAICAQWTAAPASKRLRMDGPRSVVMARAIATSVVAKPCTERPVTR